MISENAAIFQWLDHLLGLFGLVGIFVVTGFNLWQSIRTTRESRQMRADMNLHAKVEADRAAEAAKARDKLYETMMRVALGVDGVVEKLTVAKEKEGFAKGQVAGLADEVAAGISAAVANPDNPLAMAGQKPKLRP